MPRAKRMFSKLFWRKHAEHDLDDELRDHVTRLAEEYLRRGLSAEEARRQALLDLGGAEQIKEQVRAQRSCVWLETLLQDLRYGARRLRRSPGFTLVAVLTLALGVGANTAIFSVLHAVLLKPLPYRDPHRLVIFWQSYRQKGLDTFPLSPANLALYRDNSQAFEKVSAFSGTGLTLTGAGEPERLTGASVTASFLDVLGVQPFLGRNFRPEEDVPGGKPVCILTYGFWQRRFGGDPAIVGKVLRLDNVPTEVVGVLPPNFMFPSPGPVLAVPLAADLTRRNPYYLWAVARLNPGVTPAQAQADTTRLLLNFARQGEEPPPQGADLKTEVYRVHEALTRGARTSLLLLLAATGTVLLIACANVANLLLARATRRTREIALRLALGASRARITRQLLVESSLLALAGALAGLTLAVAAVALLPGLPLDDLPRIRDVAINGNVLAFAGALAVLTGLVFGLAPALRSARSGLLTAVQEGARGSGGVATQRMNKTLAAAQFALSLMLLVGAGLLLKSFQHLLAVNPGFHAENVLTLQLSLPEQQYGNEREDNTAPAATPIEPREIQFYESLLERVRAIPGVRSAAVTVYLPFGGSSEEDNYIVDGQELTTVEVTPVAGIRNVSADYFETLGIPVQQGRAFLASDTKNSPPVAIVDETLARRHWPRGDAEGKRIRFAWRTANPPPPWMTIVGVVGAVKHEALDEQNKPHLYLPYRQWPRITMYLAVRTVADPAAATAAIRAKIHELDPNLPAFAVRTLTAAVGETLATRRLTNLLLGGFAALAALLAAVGIYGVMSLHVGSRTRELGIRLALGAAPQQLLRSILRHSLQIALAGIVVGALGALLLTRAMASLLFEVEAQDPVTFASVAALLALVALVACWLPARRAMRVDPAITLRYE